MYKELQLQIHLTANIKKPKQTDYYFGNYYVYKYFTYKYKRMKKH